MSFGVGCRCGSDLASLWLWRRLAATALIRLLAWEPPYAAGAALEKAKRRKKKITTWPLGKFFFLHNLYAFYLFSLPYGTGLNLQYSIGQKAVNVSILASSILHLRGRQFHLLPLSVMSGSGFFGSVFFTSLRRFSAFPSFGELLSWWLFNFVRYLFCIYWSWGFLFYCVIAIFKCENNFAFLG